MFGAYLNHFGIICIEPKLITVRAITLYEVTVTYILSCTVSRISWISGTIFAVDTWYLCSMHLFGAKP